MKYRLVNKTTLEVFECDNLQTLFRRALSTARECRFHHCRVDHMILTTEANDRVIAEWGS